MLMTSRLLTILVCVCVCGAVVVAADLVIFFPEVQRCTIGAFVGAGVLPAALQVGDARVGRLDLPGEPPGAEDKGGLGPERAAKDPGGRAVGERAQG